MSDSIPRRIDLTPATSASDIGDPSGRSLFGRNERSKQTDLQRKNAELTAAIRGSSIEIIELLLKPSNINELNDRGQSPLVTAMIYYSKGAYSLDVYKKISKLLVDRGADVNQVQNREVPLTIACFLKDEDLVNDLLCHGASLRLIEGAKLSGTTAAVRKNSPNIIRKLKSHGADINEQDDTGMTPLTTGISGNCLGSVKCVLDHGADVNQIDGTGYSPATLSIKLGLPTILKALLEKSEIRINQADGHGQTLMTAVASRSLGFPTTDRMIRDLKSAGADIDGVDKKGRTPLTTSAVLGNVQVAKSLVRHGADVEKVDGNKQTVLLAGISRKQKRVVDFLLSPEVNADVDHGADDGEIPLNAAIQGGDGTIVDELLKKGANVNQIAGTGESPMTTGVFFGKTNLIDKLLNHSADINQIAGKGHAPLLTAIASENATMVRHLKRKGADVNQVFTNGNRPLTHAVQSGSCAIVDIILDPTIGPDGVESVVPDINQPAGNGQAPLTTSVLMGNSRMTATLLRSGAEVNRLDGNGKSAIGLAVQSNNKEMVSLLKQHGADVNLIDGSGQAPLALAIAMDGGADMVQLLLSLGSDIDSTDGSGRTPLTLAVAMGRMEIVQLLISLGADTDLADGTGDTPMLLAIMGGDKHLVKILADLGNPNN